VCAGSTLELCLAGRRVPVDCAALGRTCGPDSYGNATCR
jgi:hypothetical protein